MTVGVRSRCRIRGRCSELSGNETYRLTERFMNSEVRRLEHWERDNVTFCRDVCREKASMGPHCSTSSPLHSFAPSILVPFNHTMLDIATAHP